MTWQRFRRYAAAGLAVAVLALISAPEVAAQAGTMQRIQYGEVVHAEPMIVQAQMTGSGAQTGATVGAVAGALLADRGDRWLGGLLGGAAGGAIGRSAEKKAKKKKGWELIILLDSGQEIAIQVADKRARYAEGDRVRLMTGGGRTKVSKIKKK